MKIIVTELNWPIGNQLLEQQGWNVVYDADLWKNRERLQQELQDADTVIVRNQTKVDAELLGWKHDLKVIGRLGVGLDNIDLKSAAERNISVVYGKNANATSVAEYVVSSLFTCSRLMVESSGDVKRGNWNRKKYTGTEIYGKTIGLIGVGEIGHRVALRAKALGLRVLGFDPFVAPYDFQIMETGIEMVKFEHLLAESDFISLHIPLTAQTRNLIDINALSRMKPTSYIINTARGGIVNEMDLHRALQEKKLAGAILDVLEKEPPESDHPLLDLDNCLITPHIAGLTEESQIRTSELVAREVIRELSGKISLCRV
ncbi:hydroxyacid dehydrogenase [Ferviditalea candida]|uniref:Hydroxyacid dehydrogenase n=1 Tax=Ferviditalea candida TaxID=3108399 RepID=A0ABU5ZH29_9BACL|nr:hydroxyacid dehydrogenase [Paenibacillaceae bacterium T2]